ncbi:MAG: amino acid adenylation domain-containing protein [Burkholderiales bacterium]|nr:amino acid adenylation domain-containing protein [Burkholderiales bacterium]
MSTSKADLLERIAHLSDEKRALLEARLAEAGKEKSTGIPKCQPMDSYPLSFAQESLWFLSQLESDSPFYNEACAVEFNGNVDHDALNWSINQIVQRHGILRTTITVTNEGQPRQVVLQNSTLTVKHINLQEWPKHVHTVQKLIEAETKQPFDLAAAPPFKVTLIQICSNKYILLLVLHHIVADRWSSRLLIQEFSVLYGAYFNDQKSPLPELSIQYADYAVWQREKLKDLLYDKHIEFWKKQLTSALPVLGLPVDLPRPPILKHQGRKYHFELPQELTIALRQFCQFNSTTLFTTLIAVFTTLLYRYIKQNDICIGFPVTNRTRIELQSLIGFFVNTLILRTDLSDSPSFTALLVRIKHTIHAAHAHQDIPFGTILDTLNPVRDTSYTPLFQTMFVFQSKTVSELDLPGIKSRLFELDSGGTKFDVTLCVSEEEGVLKAWFEYNTELFFEQTMVRWARHYQQLLEVAITRPDIPIDVLNYLSHEERQQLLLDWNATEVLYTQDRCIHQLFEEQVEKNPDAVAVIFGERQLTYGQLNAKANQLAHYLRAQEVGPEVLVGICVERSLEMVAGILAILKAGGAYVPIDPKAPQERIADVLSNARPALVLTQEKLREQLPSAIQLFNLDSEWSQIAQERTDPVTSAVTPDNLAYVLHTSGSTGKPKGVAVTHRNVVNSTQARLDYYQQPIDSFLLLSSVIFDSSIVGLFGTLSQGGRLVFPQDDALLDVSYLTRLITDYKVSHLLAVPSLYKAILRQIATGHADTSLEAVLIAGETCYPDLVKLHDQLLPQTELFNEYGPTEATVWSSVHQIQQEAIQHTVSIGRPIANTQIYLLDAYQNPVPVGVPGELYIGGIGLARGYLNRSNLTAERFIPNPFSKQLGERLYRTGDLARYRADGNIEYLGRTDHQVKIRGFRIELGEIEAALLQHEQIKEAVAIVREDNPGDKRLVAYVVDHASTLDIETIRSYLKTHLPDYMIPAAFVFLDNLPLNSNGKLDRKALPIPDISHQLIHEYVAPRNLAEEILANIWAEVLGVEKVGIYDNFFELGGDSILSIQMTSRARQAGIVLTPKEFFQYQTIGKLAANINNVGETKQQIAEQGLITGSVPLVPIQHWFFEQKLPNSYHWNQSIVLEAKEAIDADIFEKIVEKLEQHHDVLRSRFFQKDGQWYQNYVAEKSKGVFQEVDLSNISNDKQQEVIEAQATEWQSSLDLLEGPIWRIVWLNFGRHRAGRLLIIIHLSYRWCFLANSTGRFADLLSVGTKQRKSYRFAT